MEYDVMNPYLPQQSAINNLIVGEKFNMKVMRKSERERTKQAIVSNDPSLLPDMREYSSDTILDFKISIFESSATTTIASSFYGSSDCLRSLLEQGAWIDDDIFTSYRKSLIYASAGEFRDCIKLLSLYGLYGSINNSNDQRSPFIQFLYSCILRKEFDFDDHGHVLNYLQSTQETVDVKLFNFLLLNRSSIETIEWCLDLRNKRSFLNKRDHYGLSPLMCSVIAGRLDSVQLLLDKGALVNLRRDKFVNEFLCCNLHSESKLNNMRDNVDGKGKTALMYACILNRLDILTLLLARGADRTYQDQGGFTALMHAAYNKHSQCVQLLLSTTSAHSNVDIDFVNTNSRSALFYAAYNGDFESVQYLLKAKANRYLKDVLNRSALVAAVISQNFECVQILLKHQAEIDVKDKSGNTPLYCAAQLGNIDILKLLGEKMTIPLHLRSKDKTNVFNEPLFGAIRFGHLDCVEYILQKGANVNEIGKSEDTPLMTACFSDGNKMEIISLLLKNGASATSITKTKKNGLIAYALKGKLEISFLKYLLNNGAKINHQNLSRQTPLMLACKFKRPDCVKLFVERGALLDEVDNEGKSALFYAVESPCLESLRCLLEHGANVDIRDWDSVTVFHHSIFASSDIHFLELLINYGDIFDAKGNLKQAHNWKAFKRSFNNGGKIRYVSLPIITLLFKIGFISWQCFHYCPFHISYAAVQNGISPGYLDLKDEHIRQLNATNCYTFQGKFVRFRYFKPLSCLSPYTPLQFAFIVHSIELIKFFLSNFYFTIHDYRRINFDEHFQQAVRSGPPVLFNVAQSHETIQLLDRLTSQPWRLETLSLLTISTSIVSLPQRNGLNTPSRSSQVDTLPIPEHFKKQLRFEGDLSTLCPVDWGRIKLELTNVVDFPLPKFVWPSPTMLVKGENNCICSGTGLHVN